MSFQRMQWLFPIAVALHNAEEAIWFPAWWLRHSGEIPRHPSPEVARYALAALTLAAFVVTYLSARKGNYGSRKLPNCWRKSRRRSRQHELELCPVGCWQSLANIPSDNGRGSPVFFNTRS